MGRTVCTIVHPARTPRMTTAPVGFAISSRRSQADHTAYASARQRKTSTARHNPRTTTCSSSGTAETTACDVEGSRPLMSGGGDDGPLALVLVAHVDGLGTRVARRVDRLQRPLELCGPPLGGVERRLELGRSGAGLGG